MTSVYKHLIFELLEIIPQQLYRCSWIQQTKLVSKYSVSPNIVIKPNAASVSGLTEIHMSGI